jgi:uncharacterized DUF497 family protein
MDIDWSPRKAAENLRKHGVDFADAVIALEDENALTIEDNDHEEQRFKTLGIGPRLNILYVVHAYRDNDCIRTISTRKADRCETEQYYRGINYE